MFAVVIVSVVAVIFFLRIIHSTDWSCHANIFCSFSTHTVKHFQNNRTKQFFLGIYDTTNENVHRTMAQDRKMYEGAQNTDQNTILDWIIILHICVVREHTDRKRALFTFSPVIYIYGFFFALASLLKCKFSTHKQKWGRFETRETGSFLFH